MVAITREHALCIFYQLKFTKTNILVAEKRFESFKDEYEICHLGDPLVPVIALKSRIYESTLWSMNTS